jgi:hypothetical protein
MEDLVVATELGACLLEAVVARGRAFGGIAATHSPCPSRLARQDRGGEYPAYERCTAPATGRGVSPGSPVRVTGTRPDS